MHDILKTVFKSNKMNSYINNKMGSLDLSLNWAINKKITRGPRIIDSMASFICS